MENTKWNKVFIKPHYNEDGIEFIWGGKIPEPDKKVLVYTSKSKKVYIDMWVDSYKGARFKNTVEPVVYWMNLPEPPRIVKQQRNISIQLKNNMLSKIMLA